MIVVLPESVYVRSLPDERLWELTRKFPCLVDGVEFNVEEGFTTDFASIPRFLWSVMDTTDPRIMRAAVLHDYMYQYHERLNVSRSFADLALRDGMRDACRASRLESWMVYRAVRWGGAFVWRNSTPRSCGLALRGTRARAVGLPAVEQVFSAASPRELMESLTTGSWNTHDK